MGASEGCDWLAALSTAAIETANGSEFNPLHAAFRHKATAKQPAGDVDGTSPGLRFAQSGTTGIRHVRYRP